jgi:hypothetical protein
MFNNIYLVRTAFFKRFEKFWTELLHEVCRMILRNADCTTSRLQCTCQFTERVIMWFATSPCYFRPLRSENSRQKSLFHTSCQAPRCTPTGNAAVLTVLIWIFLHNPRLWVDGDTSLYTVTARNTGETSTLQNKHILVLVVCFCSNSTYPDARSDTFGSQCSPSTFTPLTPHRFPIAGSSACLFVVVKGSDMMRAMGGVGESGTQCRVRGSTRP